MCLNRVRNGGSGNRDTGRKFLRIASFLYSKLGYLLASKDFIRKPRLETENRQCLTTDIALLWLPNYNRWMTYMYMFLAEAWGHSSVRRRKIADIILLYKGHNNATIQASCAGSNIPQATLVTMGPTGPTGRWINTYGGTRGTLMCHWVTCTKVYAK